MICFYYAVVTIADNPANVITDGDANTYTGYEGKVLIFDSWHVEKRDALIRMSKLAKKDAWITILEVYRQAFPEESSP